MFHKILVVILPALVFGATASLFAAETAKSEYLDPWAREKPWAMEAKEILAQKLPIPPDHFDKLFNDSFFGRKFDPFEEVESAEDRLAPLFKEEDRALFRRSFRNWFESRMEVVPLNPVVTSTKFKITLAFKVPDTAEGKSFKVDISKSRIRISYERRESSEKNDAKTGVHEKNESIQQVEKVMPVPPGADASSARTEREGDTVKIVFDRK